MKRSEALKLRKLVEQAVVSLDDKSASEGAALFPRLKGDGSLIKTGTRINWKSIIKRAASDLWDTAENTPEAAPALWEDINYKDGYRIISATLTVGTAFEKDECGWWNDVLYKSVIAANVYTPEQYPAGWEVL